MPPNTPSDTNVAHVLRLRPPYGRHNLWVGRADVKPQEISMSPNVGRGLPACGCWFPVGAYDAHVAALVVRALLFTDIEGSTGLVRRLGDRYEDVLERHHGILRSAATRWSGMEQSREGDSLFITFASATAAVQAAADAQRRIEGERWPADGRVRVRMGVHVGEVAVSSAGLVGLAIHQAARIMSAARGGQVVVSGEVVRQASGIPDDITIRSLGVHELRDIGSVPLFQVEHPELQRDFPPLRTRLAVAHNVPMPLTSLVGRVEEREAVSALLAPHRLVTLVGEGGCGKTRLAVRVAADALDRFVDGVWFVDLAALAPGSDVPSRAAQVLGVDGGIDELLSALGQRQMLIVLDNCEHVIQSAAEMVAAVLRGCATTTVMCTSRAPLDVAGEVCYRVPPLTVPRSGTDVREARVTDAVELFTTRAELVRPGFQASDGDVDAIIELCSRLEGLPLAIELAAARLRAMSLTELVARFDDRYGVLIGGPRSAPHRQQSLRNTMDWSFQLLNRDEQQVLCQLAAFRGGCDVESAEAVCGLDSSSPGRVLDALIGLVDKSLVTVAEYDGSTRYHLHETIREYALSTLSEQDREATAARHARWFAVLAGRLSEGPAPGGERSWIRRHDDERDNFTAAAEWLLRNDAPAALRLLLDVEPGIDLTASSTWCYQLIDRVLPQAVGASPGDRAHALAEMALGNYAPDDPIALTLCSQAVAMLPDVDDPAAECAVLAAMTQCHGAIAGGAPDPDEVAAAVAAGDRAGGTYWPIMVRRFLSYRAPPPIAESLVSGALRIAEQLKLEHFSALLRRDLATIAQFLGRGREALAIYRELEPELDADNSFFYALAEGEHGEIPVGLHFAEDLALQLLERPHDRSHAAALHTLVAHLHRLAGDLDRCESAVEMTTRAGEPTWGFVGELAIITRSALSRLRGRPDSAAAIIEPACARLGTEGITDISMRVLEELAAVALALDRQDDATNLLTTATEARQRHGKPASPAWQTEVDALRASLGDEPGTTLDVADATAVARSMAHMASP